MSVKLETPSHLDLGEQALALTTGLGTLASAILADGFRQVEMVTTLQEARALDVLSTKEFWTMTDFAKALGVTLPTASHAASRLVRKRAVKRSRLPQDRRVVLISLSARGVERQNAILQNRMRICSEILLGLTPGQRKTTVAAVRGLAVLAAIRLANGSENP